MVDAAVRHSREGSIFVRDWRYLRGEPRPIYLSADLKYSRLVIDRFVTRVDKALSRKPVDAHLEFSGGFPHRRAGKEGLDIRHAALREQVVAALAGKAPDRVVEVVPRVVKPKVLRANLAAEYPYLITIDRSNFRLRFFRHLKLVKSYPIAVGMAGLETPAGLYHIQNKQVDPAWSVPNKPWAGSLAGRVIPGGSPENPLKARWLGIYNGAGIHGTDNIGSLGSAASHGCIRMAVPDVIELYDKVPVQTPVYIE
jgi:lipoprotein-anchoring transpeptidase ErfK/SrfK